MIYNVGSVPAIGGRAAVREAFGGISEATFGDWRRRGLIPDPLPGTKRWHIPTVMEHVARAQQMAAAKS